MTVSAVSVTPDTPVEEIAAVLLRHRINGVPVIDAEGGLVGIVTTGDLIRRGADDALEARESIWKENFWRSVFTPEGARPDKAHGRFASEVMTERVITVAPDADASLAARLLTDHRITGMPVVDPAGRVVGMVSRIDLVRHLGALAGPGRGSG